MSDTQRKDEKPSAGRRLTVRQVAETWQVYAGTVRRAIRAGELPAVWAGNGYRLAAEDVEAWVEKKWGYQTRLGLSSD